MHRKKRDKGGAKMLGGNTGKKKSGKQTPATMQDEDMKTLLWSITGNDQEKSDELQEQEKRPLEKYLK